MKWNDASTKILADVGDGYVSSYNLLEMGRVNNSKIYVVTIKRQEKSMKQYLKIFKK